MTTKEQVMDIIKQYTTMHSLLNTIIHRIESEINEPQVKQLMWEDNIATAFNIATPFNIDGSAFNYEIDKREYDYSIYCFNIFLTTHQTLDEAKAYAQQHFEGLIKSCLEGE